MMAARQQRVPPVAHGVEAGVEEPRQKEDQDRLGDLRGLKGEEAAEANPAMGVVRAGKKKTSTSSSVVTQRAG